MPGPTTAAAPPLFFFFCGEALSVERGVTSHRRSSVGEPGAVRYLPGETATTSVLFANTKARSLQQEVSPGTAGVSRIINAIGVILKDETVYGVMGYSSPRYNESLLRSTTVVNNVRIMENGVQSTEYYDDV